MAGVLFNSFPDSPETGPRSPGGPALAAAGRKEANMAAQCALLQQDSGLAVSDDGMATGSG